MLCNSLVVLPNRVGYATNLAVDHALLLGPVPTHFSDLEQFPPFCTRAGERNVPDLEMGGGEDSLKSARLELLLQGHLPHIARECLDE